MKETELTSLREGRQIQKLRKVRIFHTLVGVWQKSGNIFGNILKFQFVKEKYYFYVSIIIHIIFFVHPLEKFRKMGSYYKKKIGNK